MAFNSYLFVLFFIASLACAYLLRNRVSTRNVILLGFSLFFYAYWDWRFLGLILFSSVVDYFCAIVLDRDLASRGNASLGSRRRKAILLMSLISNLGLLGFFKYFNFFIDSAAEIISSFGMSPNLPSLRIILPVGISFYTFQALSYTIDVYRGRLPAQRHFVTFFLFIAFYPQLVAGPIVRATDLIPQLARPNRITRQDLGMGMYLMLWGLFKKTVIADNVASFSDAAFASNPTSGLYAVLGVLAFTIQIYCDFSGYSDIARGSARCMGFDFMLNFNLPYFCTSVGDFYRRWHISLSTWLRDYLYIPLGGSRVPTGRLYYNLMLTMVLGGLWHGASWTFVLWGTYQGVLLCAQRALQPVTKAVAPTPGSRYAGLWHFGNLLFFFPFTLTGRLLFRADSPQQVWAFVESAFVRFPGTTPGWVTYGHLFTLAACFAFLFAFQLLQYKTRDLNIVYRMPTPIRAVFYALLVIGIVTLGECNGGAFIYFQF